MKNPILEVYFYKTEAGNEPVRQWLQSLNLEDKKRIGEDIKTVQFGWPLGMPLIKHLESDIWEVRCNLRSAIARVLFVIDGKSIVLVHGFIKNQQKISQSDMDLAKNRVKLLRRHS
ncbi:phage-related protein [Polynucleobacter sphagniphilus]|jgi:phage-related protein|uniref:Phage-related protein n=1 Tax=Polynucleobacter sphagniphilus TaxID=1743169 RepID=A0AA43M6M7_9BURK|nr:type II toxin-antitoxin system RelE/ParE family toxin [Polynucleobacter sphagniphilus]MDH6240690.1 phage-related protein [Polynucleobacter sphagniphilus]MDH6420540.1 phage-related protein [Polynucleobacter sphagniphilus]MDH6503113.1 phage-related protein [Polynucleobacter sphagniphilus]MDH6512061.1 phage-related protein [Polynucleobacter sphagniphilus]MDH6525381.1 phage-related protein [Polynucleobacter sphagniphilus]